MKNLVLVVVAVLAVTLIGGANAITYGQPDGNLHPNVGAMIRLRPSDNQLRIVCSGSLISPTVFLTASHCTSFVESTGQTDIWVTFDSSFTPKSKLLHGTMHTNPLYNQSQSDPEDIAVIILDKPVANITPVRLPKAGLLDEMKANGTLRDHLFTSVGYGVQEPTTGPGGITHEFPMERWYAVGQFWALSNVWLRIAQTQATGDGGTCSGDSGGAQFLGAGATETPIQTSITITGDIECFASNVDYRLDTPQARAFLGQFVTLP
jgi:hypothetical protein